MKKNNTLIIGVISFCLLLVFVGLFLYLRKPKSKGDSLTIEGSDRKLELESSGAGSYKTGGNYFDLSFGKNQYGNIVKYLKNHAIEGSVDDVGNYYIVRIIENGVETIYYIPKDDQIFSNLDDYVQGGGGDEGTDGSGDQGGGGNDVFDFSTPTPTPVSGGITPSSTPPSDCPMWLLSYCLYPKSPKPLPSITPTPNPEAVEDCSFWSRFVNVRAVISNTYCVSSSPTPTP